MSLYICNDETVSVVARLLLGRTTLTDQMVKVPVVDYSHTSQPEQMLGRDLRQLNAYAVAALSPESRPAPAQDFAYQRIKVSDVQAAKALECLLAQCDEAPANERKLFKTMAAVLTEVVGECFRASAPYQAATWGIIPGKTRMSVDTRTRRPPALGGPR